MLAERSRLQGQDLQEAKTLAQQKEVARRLQQLDKEHRRRKWEHLKRVREEQTELLWSAWKARKHAEVDRLARALAGKCRGK